MNLINELQHRNVIRMAGLYLVGAWLIVQVASTVTGGSRCCQSCTDHAGLDGSIW
ncbi:MAG: hypothetical protein ACT4NL_15905 [Pseudomarimonas sp.]